MTDTRRRALRTLALLAVFAAISVAVVGAASATLSGSTFNAGDGNMKIDSGDTHDWQDATTYFGSAYTGDLKDPVASTSDDAFTPGQKQDTICPDVSGQKSPPKDDFTDFAYASETNAAGNIFLYGSTFRFAGNGNASENIELNQGTNGTCAGSSLFDRVAGDKLIAIDYLNGGTNAQFNVLTWIDGTDANNPTCFVSNDNPPCWGAVKKTLSASQAEGKVNQLALPAAENYIQSPAADVGQFQFAEFGVNLTSAIGLTGCGKFARTLLEARASGSSFVSTTKDIILGNKALAPCPKISTTATGGTFPANGSLSVSDRVTLTDAPATATGKITVKVYGPDDATCTNPPFGSQDLALSQVSGNVNHDYTASFPVAAAGTYRFTAALFLGTHTTADASSGCNATNETATVSRRPTTLTTDAGGPYAPTNSLTDTATLSGGTSDATGSITFKLFADNGSGGCGAQIGSDQVVTVNNGADGKQYQATVTNSAIGPGASGNATFHWTASYSGDGKNSTSSSGCGATKENPVVLWPHIKVEKTPDNQTIETGTTASFTIKVTNDGNVDLTNVNVTDANSPGCNNTHGALAKGANYSYTCSSPTLTADLHNVAHAEGTAGNTTVSAEDAADVDVIHPAIDVKKNPPVQSVPVGGTANFMITVTNIGDVTLANVVVTDAQAPGCAATKDGAGGTLTVAGLASMAATGATSTLSYSCSKSPVNTAFVNVVSACGTDPLNTQVCDTDTNGGNPPPGCPATEADRCAFVNIETLTTDQDFRVKDTAHVSGLSAPVGGSLTFTLYKDPAGMKTCDPADLVTQSSPIPVNANGDYTFAPSDLLSVLVAAKPLLTPGTAGNYNWQVSYSGDLASGGTNHPITGACGTENLQVSNG